MSTKLYKKAALGGTFDRFHKGHETLIDHAYSVAEEIVVGITKDNLTTYKELSRNIEPYEIRLNNLRNFSSKHDKKKETTLVELQDIFGPTLTDTTIDCLVVSPLTANGAKVINQTRRSKRLPELPVEVCNLAKAEDGEYISSTRIRQGEINREGFVYSSLLSQNWKATENHKIDLKQPLGKLIPNNIENELKEILTNWHPTTVAVGDETSLFCYQHHLPIHHFIFDNHIQRQPIIDSIQRYLPITSILKLENPAGTLSPQLVIAFKELLKHKKHLQVVGEEDLIVLAAILLLPLNSLILYGQPNEGVVVVEVSEEKKEWCRGFINKV